MNPVIKITPIGNLGNQMLQLMLAQSLVQRVPSLEVTGYSLPDWHIRASASITLPATAIKLKGQHIDFEAMVVLLKHGLVSVIDLSALGFRMEHYLPREFYQQYFQAPDSPGTVVNDDVLLINVRGAEILGNVHEDYGPIPLAFYEQIIQTTGLRPIFMGQIADDAYSTALKRRFNGAEFIPSRGVMQDFRTLRGARNIVASVSTFSWLAAWLSDATTVHLPMLGIFNPIQRPDIDLLPLADSRYRFYEFPRRSWRGTPKQIDVLHTRNGEFPLLSAEDVRLRLVQAQQRIRWRKRRYRAALLYRVLMSKMFGKGGGVIMAQPSASTSIP